MEPGVIVNPKLWRWLNADPIGLAGGLNLYAYVGNNPISGIDPLGLFLGTPLSAGEYLGSVATGVGEGFQHNVIDPMGTIAGLAVYTNVPGTIKLGLGIGAAGYAEVGRSDNGSYTATGGFGDGFGYVYEVSTKAPTNPTITGPAFSYGAGLQSESHVGPASVEWGADGNASFGFNGNYAIEIRGDASAALTGSPFSIGGEAGPTMTGNVGNPTALDGSLTGPPEGNASLGFGSFIFVGVHAGFTWGGKHECP